MFMFIRAYLRASTKEQDANRAKDELIAFAREHGHKIAAFYQNRLANNYNIKDKGKENIKNKYNHFILTTNSQYKNGMSCDNNNLDGKVERDGTCLD